MSMPDGLRGVIFSTGVPRGRDYHVPQETVHQVYDDLTERLDAGENIPIGYDHIDTDTVAWKSGLAAIGRVEEVELGYKGNDIVMTKSSLKLSAKYAFDRGRFDGFGFSLRYRAEFEDNGDRNRILTHADVIMVDVVTIPRVHGALVGNVNPLTPGGKVYNIDNVEPVRPASSRE